jgi:polyphosphate kinase
MDLESITAWEAYPRAKDEMFVHTDIAESPWFDVEAEDKKRARINMLTHLLSTIPYEPVSRPRLTLPKRPPAEGYRRSSREMLSFVPDVASALERQPKPPKPPKAPKPPKPAKAATAAKSDRHPDPGGRA